MVRSAVFKSSNKLIKGREGEINHQLDLGSLQALPGVCQDSLCGLLQQRQMHVRSEGVL